MDKLPGSYKILDDGSLVPNLDDSAMADRAAEERTGETEILGNGEGKEETENRRAGEPERLADSPDLRLPDSPSPEEEVIQ